MTTIINFLIDHTSEILTVFVIGIFSMVLTYLIYWITNRNRFIKYLLGIVLVFFGVYSLSIGLNNIIRPEGIVAISRGIYAGVAGLVSILFALILGINNKGKRKKPRAKNSKKGA